MKLFIDIFGISKYKYYRHYLNRPGSPISSLKQIFICYLELFAIKYEKYQLVILYFWDRFQPRICQIRKKCVQLDKNIVKIVNLICFLIYYFRSFPRDTLHSIIMQDMHHDANNEDICFDLENLPNFIMQMIEKV